MTGGTWESTIYLGRVPFRRASQPMDERLAGRYRVDEVLGQGSMGVVYRAYDEVLDRFVALKELRAPVGLDPAEAVERFLTEARAAARLHHPAIVTVHDVMADGDRVLLAMALLEGPTLAEVISDADGGLPVSQVRSAMVQVAAALSEAHAAGVVHRDLKPDNVFWLPSGRIVVCDFGLARIGAGRGTRLGTVMGTPGYLAPEQVRGEPTGPQADVFSWGALGYELASGRPAFGDPTTEDPATMIWRVVHDDPPPLALAEDQALADIIAWALRKDPDDRPVDGAALLAALGGDTASPPTPRQAAPRPLPGSPRNRRPLVIGAGVVLALLIVVLIVALAGGGGDDQVVVKPPATSSDSAQAGQEDGEQPGSSVQPTVGTSATVAVPSPTTTSSSPRPGCPSLDGNVQRRTSFSSPPPVCIDSNKKYTAGVETDVGVFDVELATRETPVTVNNFVVLARYKYYDGVPFHRVIPGFVVQGGDGEAGDGTGGPGYTFGDELPRAGQYNVGSVAMANSGADTNGSQFFIVTGADGVTLPPSYSLFGRVISGLDVVKRIEVDGSKSGAPRVLHEIRRVVITET